MAERSLRATPEGIHKAKKVVKNNGWTQKEIGEQVGTTRQPIGKFFAGKPIERPTFIDICRLLGLNWEDIAEPEPVEQNQNTSIDIEALVQEVREKIKPDIQERCGTMRVLDMSQPIGLNDIYTNVNILEKITGRRRKEIAELLQECNSEDFDRFGLGRISEERVPGLEAVEKYSKVMILGKPGAGKTTFLKYLAILCNNGNDKGRDTVGAGLGNNSRRPQTRSQQNPPSQPSLLCLAFEESGDFPANRSELYKEGLDALLKKWDAKRGIYRDQVYKKLSVQRKEELLSKIALTTFERGDYFFKQKVAEQYIIEYIRNLPDANADPEALQLDSEVVLRSIEYQHGLLVERAKGIYSFSHLTFHEYFTAKEIVFGTQPLEEALQNLVSHINDKRWQEVFLLAVGMSSADRLLLLMKQQADALISTDEKLQELLMWVSDKSLSVDISCNLAGIRVSYLSLSLPILHVRDFKFSPCIPVSNYTFFDEEGDSITQWNYFFDFAFIFDIDINLCNILSNQCNPVLELDNQVIRFLYYPFQDSFSWNNLDDELQSSLQQLGEQIPSENADVFQKWWQGNGQAWTDELRALLILNRNIGHDWQFSTKQQELLQQYYDGNKFLVKCLNSDCYVSREVRQEIEDTLLLPIAEIEKRKHG